MLFRSTRSLFASTSQPRGRSQRDLTCWRVFSFGATEYFNVIYIRLYPSTPRPMLIYLNCCPTAYAKWWHVDAVGSYLVLWDQRCSLAINLCVVTELSDVCDHDFYLFVAISFGALLVANTLITNAGLKMWICSTWGDCHSCSGILDDY